MDTYAQYEVYMTKSVTRRIHDGQFRIDLALGYLA